MPFWTFWLWVGTSVLGALLAKGPGNAKASSIDADQVPTAEEGKPLYLVLGTCEVSGPNVVWWGDRKTKAIKKKTGGFFGLGRKSYTAGYKYYVGMQMVLGMGPIDALEDIVVGERSLKAAGVSFPKASSEGGIVFNLNLPELFGGEEQEGGLQGDIAFYFGSRTQAADSYLMSRIGKALPGYRDVCYAVLRQLYIGTQRYLKAWKWRVRCCPVGPGMSSSTSNIDGDANAAHAIAWLLTLDPEAGGLGEPLSRLDMASFTTAATTLKNEGFGVSLLLDQQQGADEWLEEILGTIDAVLYEDPSTGLWTLQLIRNDYTPSSLLHLQEGDGILSFERTIPHWSETINRVVVEYTDRAAGFVTATAQDQDLANKVIQGRDVPVTLKFPAISNRTTAQKVVGRELRTRSYPLMIATIEADRRAWRLRRGSVFRVSWPDDGLVERVFRVTSIRYGALEIGKITIEAVEDIFGVLESAIAPPPASEWQDPLALPVPAAAQALVEAPYWVAGGEVRNILTLGARGDVSTESFDLLTNEGGGYLTTGSVPCLPTGLLAAAWNCKTSALDIVGFTVGSGQDLDQLPERSTNADGRDRGDNLFIVGNEWGAWTTCADNGDGTYTVTGVLRGVLDTVPEDHAAGDRVWFLAAGDESIARQESAGGGGAASPGEDGQGYRWRGEWTASAVPPYEAYDTVEHQGSTWVALQASTTQAPPTLPTTSNAYWQLAAKAGRDGIDGEPGVSTFEETTRTLTTASLAPGATATGTLEIKRTADILWVETDYPAWIRVYGSVAERTTDASRLITEDSEPGSGVFVDSSTPVPATGSMRVWQQPVPVFVNHNVPRVDVAYVAVRNLDAVARAITLTLAYLPQEA